MSEPIYRSRPGGFDLLPASMPAAREVATDIYVSEGLSNSYLVVTDEGRVVINTGMGFEAPVHKRNYDAISEAPIRYILLTQGHVDHVGGVDFIRQEGTEIVAQSGIIAHQRDDERIASLRAARSAFAFKDVIATALAHMQAGGGAGTVAQSKPKPTITFEERHGFELGGTRFELIGVPGGETRDSMLIWLPERKICFSGNLFSALFGHIPNLVTIRGDKYRDPLLFIDSIDEVLALEPELLLVGHHGPVVGRDRIREEIERVRRATLHVHDETVEGMNAHKSIHTLMQEIRLPAELEVGEGYGKVSWDVRAIWEYYAGWFHHDSTTELYPEPPSCIHADLLELAGGPDAVAERAMARVQEGRGVEAVYLAEVVLSEDPVHRLALEANLAAHELLDAASENFWLSSWLRKEAAQLRALLDGEASSAGSDPARQDEA